MVKRAVSKRWAVEPGYEPPLTRLKVRADPTLAPPRTQDVPLPSRTRRPRVADAPAVEPPVQNAEEMDQGNTANEAQSVEQMMDIAAENHVEDVSTGNQMITVSQMSKILEDQNRQSDAEEEQRETVPENQTMTNVDWGQIGGMTPHDNQNETEVSCGQTGPTASEIQMDEMIDESEVEASSSEYQFLYTPEWTDEDQRTLEEEIRIASAKPKDQRRYSWNLIVGKSGVNQTGGSNASDLMQGGADRENDNSQAVKKPAASRGTATNEANTATKKANTATKEANATTKEANTTTKEANTAAEKLVAAASVAPAESVDKPDNTDAPSKVDAAGVVENVDMRDRVGLSMSQMMISSTGPSAVKEDKEASDPDAYRPTDEEICRPEITGLREVFARGLGGIVKGRGQEYISGKARGQKNGPGKESEQEHGSGKESGQEHGSGKESGQEHGSGKESGQEHGSGKESGQEHGSGKESGQEHGPSNVSNGVPAEVHAAAPSNLQRQPPAVTVQKPTMYVPEQVVPPQQAEQVVPPQQAEELPPQPMEANNGQSNNGQDANESAQHAAPSILDALKRNALLLSTEPAFEKLDIITDRRFRLDSQFQRLHIPNAQLQFSVVSYSLMAELETEEEETKAEGYLGAARIGIGIEADDDPSGRNTALIPSNYCDRVLLELDYLKSDILCFQAIAEWYWSKLERTLNNLGYYGYKMDRRPGPGSYCEAIFYRPKRFMLVTRDGAFLDELISEQSDQQPGVIYNRGIRESVKSREVVCMMTLRCKQSGRKFRVVNMRCVPEHKHRPDLQALQVCSVLQRLEQLNAEPGGRIPTILCGNMDFQADSDQGPYQLVRDGFLRDATTQRFNSIDSTPVSLGQKCPLATAYRVGFQHSMGKLMSAYDKVLGSEPPTVWKRASETFVCGSYVWFDAAELNVVGVLEMAASNAVTDSGIPNELFPSGSLSLKARFQFADEDVPPTAAAGQGV